MMDTSEYGEMHGTVGWSGTINGRPAVVTAYRGGASIYIYQWKFLWGSRWTKKDFPNIDVAYKDVGISG